MFDNDDDMELVVKSLPDLKNIPILVKNEYSIKGKIIQMKTENSDQSNIKVNIIQTEFSVKKKDSKKEDKSSETNQFLKEKNQKRSDYTDTFQKSQNESSKTDKKNGSQIDSRLSHYNTIDVDADIESSYYKNSVQNHLSAINVDKEIQSSDLRKNDINTQNYQEISVENVSSMNKQIKQQTAQNKFEETQIPKSNKKEKEIIKFFQNLEPLIQETIKHYFEELSKNEFQVLIRQSIQYEIQNIEFTINELIKEKEQKYNFLSFITWTYYNERPDVKPEPQPLFPFIEECLAQIMINSIYKSVLETDNTAKLINLERRIISAILRKYKEKFNEELDLEKMEDPINWEGEASEFFVEKKLFRLDLLMKESFGFELITEFYYETIEESVKEIAHEIGSIVIEENIFHKLGLLKMEQGDWIFYVDKLARLMLLNGWFDHSTSLEIVEVPVFDMQEGVNKKWLI